MQLLLRSLQLDVRALIVRVREGAGVPPVARVLRGPLFIAVLLVLFNFGRT